MLEEIKDYQMDIVSKATAMTVIRNAPTVKAKPVICGHDRWKVHKEHCEFWCSECGYWLREVYGGDDMDEYFKYCPNCGAYMRGCKND